VLGFAIVTLGLIAETGHRGGQINQRNPHRAASDGCGRVSFADIELLINSMQWFVPANPAFRRPPDLGTSPPSPAGLRLVKQCRSHHPSHFPWSLG
jgi:hypothetical protein